MNILRFQCSSEFSCIPVKNVFRLSPICDLLFFLKTLFLNGHRLCWKPLRSSWTVFIVWWRPSYVRAGKKWRTRKVGQVRPLFIALYLLLKLNLRGVRGNAYGNKSLPIIQARFWFSCEWALNTYSSCESFFCCWW